MRSILELVLFLTVLTSKISFGQGLLCYRCDSAYNGDCMYYPAPLSTYEKCSEKPKRTSVEYKKFSLADGQSDETPQQQPLYLRYRYKICPLLEKTVKHYISLSDFCATADEPARKPSPMEGPDYVCGKAVTHGPHGPRIRRGCTPDLLVLNGTHACVSHTPYTFGEASVACFCSSDFCNKAGPSMYTAALKSISLAFIVNILIVKLIV